MSADAALVTAGMIALKPKTGEETATDEGSDMDRYICPYIAWDYGKEFI